MIFRIDTYSPQRRGPIGESVLEMMMATQTVRLRVICNHPHSAYFGLQDKNKAIDTGAPLDDTRVYFDFELKVKHADSGQPNFTGQYAHGTVQERFVYLTTKDQQDKIVKRIKVHLKTIQWAQVQHVLDSPNAFLEARVEGHLTGSVPLLGEGWVVRTAER